MPADLLASLMQHPLREPLWVFDAEGRLLQANGGARDCARLLGEARLSALLGRALADLRGADRDSRAFDDLLPGERLELRAVRDAAGALLGYTASASAAELPPLRADERELLLDRAQRIGGMGAWIWQIERDRFWTSLGVRNILGLTAARGDLRYADLGRFVPDPRARARLRQSIAATIARGEAYEQEFDLRREDGERRRVIARGEALRDAAGEVDRVFGLLQDVTEQRQAEDVAGRRNELLDRIARIGRIGGWEYNIDSGRLDWTDENYRIHGIAVGTPVSIHSTNGMYEGESRQIFEAAVRRIVSGESDEETIEVRFVTPDEERVWLRIHGQLERHNGKPYRITGHTRDITAERESSERIEQLAHYDALTGLPNRVQFRELACAALARQPSERAGLALLFIDLDRFKLVNDTLGHEAGDQLLLDVAGRIRATVRSGDIVARQSGDEFLVLLRDIGAAADASRVARKIIDAVAIPVALDGTDIQVGCSIGIALHGPAHDGFDALLRAADTAMYAAKESGRNTFQFYSDAYYTQLQRRATLEKELRQALRQDELYLVYQPTVDLGDGRLRGVEALLRWRHDDEARPPSEFVPIAEDSGEIVPIGYWALREACRQAAAWAREGLRIERLAVNVSAIQLRVPGFAAEALDICRREGWPPQRLELELTESALMRDSDSLRRSFALFEASGIGLSVDDFGTGFSNLHSLHRFPVKHLKIDRSFVHGLIGDRTLERLTQTIIALAHGLELRVVAEGVETAAVAQRLRELGCDEAQGFLYATPMDGAALADWVRRGAAAPLPAADSPI